MQLALDGHIPAHRSPRPPIRRIGNGQTGRVDEGHIGRGNEWAELSGKWILREAEIRISEQHAETLHLWAPGRTVHHIVVRFHERWLIEKADAAADRGFARTAHAVCESDARRKQPVGRTAATRGATRVALVQISGWCVLEPL